MIYPTKKNINKKQYKIGKKIFVPTRKQCEICETDKTVIFQNCGKIGNKPGIYGYLPIRICKICSLKFISPRPSDIFYKKFFKLDYGATFFGGKYKPNKNHQKFQKIRGKLIFDYFKKFINKKSKILDHGCSTGLTMLPWKKNGYNINGIDPHQPAVNYGREKHNLKIDFAFGEKLPYKKNTYDAVISLGSLEHCFNVNKSLREINKILNLNGILIIRWRSDKLIGSPLEYFNYNTLRFFNKAAWKIALNKNNFQIKKFINSKIEKYDSFEYILAVKKNNLENIKMKKAYKNQIKQFKKTIDRYKKLCRNIKSGNLHDKNYITKKRFIKQQSIGLMNIGKKNSVERFFAETKYFLSFINKFEKSK